MLYSCGSAPDFETSNPPVWLADTQEYCGDKHLCAVGQGSSLQVADARARSEIAKIFETQVSTELKASEAYRTGAEINENYFSQVTESSDQTVENVKILSRWKKSGEREVFSLAGINRKSAQNKIEEKLGPIISKLEAFANTVKRSDLIRAKKLYPTIYPLLAQWRVVSDSDYQYSPTEAELVKFSLARFKRPIQVNFQWSGDQDLRITLRDYLKDLLLKSGYHFGKSSITYELKGSVIQRDVPISMKGYIKKEFELTIDVFLGNKIVGSLHHNFKTAGKNWGQLKERARLNFMKIIFEKLENLNIN